MKYWADLDSFPISYQVSSILEQGVEQPADYSTLKHKSSRWALLNPLLVSGSSSNKMLPPICDPDFNQVAHRGILLTAKLVLGMTTLAIATAFILSVNHDEPVQLYKIAAAFSAILVFLIADYLLVKQRIHHLQDRAFFIHFIKKEVSHHLALTLSLFCVISAVQLIYHYQDLTIRELVVRYGAHFPSIERGESWRLIVGPFIHSSLLHWITNFLILGLALSLALPIGRAWSFWIFTMSLIGSTLCVYFLPMAERPEGLVGISGGIFGLLGAVTVVSLKFHREFPRYMGVSLLLFLLLDVFVSSLTMESTSEAAHVGGALIGSLFGLLLLKNLPFTRTGRRNEIQALL